MENGHLNGTVTPKERVWERFLTDQDRALAQHSGDRREGFGTRPAVLLVDLYRWVFGDREQPLLEAVKEWPGYCGPSGWQAVPHIQALLRSARAAGIPVIHITGTDEVTGWSGSSNVRRGDSPEMAERRRKRFEIIPEVGPIEGEPVITKASPSAFWGTPLAGYLNELKVDTLIVGGESTSGCVRATVVDGRTYRYKMIVVEECVFDRTEASHAINLFDMHQKYADVLSLAEVSAYLESYNASPRSAELAGTLR